VFTISKSKIFFLLWLLTIPALSVQAADIQLDKSKYITIDEIRPGMEAYCLTCYKGTKIEKFNIEVISVIRNHKPGKNAILVQGTDPRFIHTGPVAGCSGSPVYIDGRLAGALAFGWTFSKDPLYGVTPIEEMLEAGKSDFIQKQENKSAYTFDFSKPVDFENIAQKFTHPQPFKQNDYSFTNALPCPLITSGLPDSVCKQLDTALKPYGFIAIAAPATASNTLNQNQKVKLTPGASLVIPLITGDITTAAVGTVTEVIGDKVYGFGHSFIGYGSIDLPMATGQVHTVVSTVVRSFKYASILEIVGALTVDESTAIVGQIGAKAKMIPLTIKVDRYNDTQQRVYNCQIINNEIFTPMLISSALRGAVLYKGSLPPDHKLDYKAVIGIKDSEPIRFENTSTSRSTIQITTESAGSVAMIMENPYKKAEITSLDFHINIAPKNIISHIWSVDIADTKLKPEDKINIDTVIESVLTGKKKYSFELKIPENTPPGKYDLIVCGSSDYKKFLRQRAPYRFTPENFDTLIQAINDLLTIRRDNLYCLLVLPSGGLIIEKAELPDLPPTRQLLLSDKKRTLQYQPFPQWLEKSMNIKTIVIDKKIIKITIEK